MQQQKRLWLVLGGVFLSVGCGGQPNSRTSTDGPVAQENLGLVAPTQINTFAVLASGRANFQDRTQLVGGHVGASAATGDAVTAGADVRLALGKSTLGSRVVLKERSSAGDLF